MSFSLPFAIPALANRTYLDAASAFEIQGATALLQSMAICLVVGAIFRVIGRRHRGGQLVPKRSDGDCRTQLGPGDGARCPALLPERNLHARKRASHFC